jgi:hypothetical protein
MDKEVSLAEQAVFLEPWQALLTSRLRFNQSRRASPRFSGPSNTSTGLSSLQISYSSTVNRLIKANLEKLMGEDAFRHE